MKQPRDIQALAATFAAAASQPPPLPPTVTPEPVVVAPTKAKDVRKRGTFQFTQRLSTTVFDRYKREAEKRTREAGRGVTAQEIIREVLEKGAP